MTDIRWRAAVSFVLIGASLMFVPAAGADFRSPLLAEPNGLAQTPPMGWNSWNKFAGNISERVIRETADAMASSGMREAGYQYVVIDDLWAIGRDKSGTLIADPKLFPNGIKKLADYVHSKGLKFGIYSDAGEQTCGGRPGSRGHEYQDANTFAAWGVDYLKYDWCNTGTQEASSSYLTMAKALRSTGRPIVFSLCEWGNASPWLWGRNVGNLWRTTGDIFDKWEGTRPNGDGKSFGVLNILDQQAGLEGFAGPGHWNDPDMLEVGNGGMSDSEYRAHFSLWAMLAAPLITGNDLTAMSDATKTILLNKEVIAVDQDPLGVQASRVYKDGDAEIWARPLANGGRAVLFLNRSTVPRDITVKWEQLHYPAGLKARLRDLWLHQDISSSSASYTANVAGHGVVMLTLTP